MVPSDLSLCLHCLSGYSILRREVSLWLSLKSLENENQDNLLKITLPEMNANRSEIQAARL